MPTHARARAEANLGVVTRQQLLDTGTTPSVIAALVRAGELRVLRRGAYCLGETWEAAEPYVERPRMLARAAVATMHRSWVLSHDSAAHELGLSILTPPEPVVHVTRPGYSSAWTRDGVARHYARFQPRQVAQVGGMRCLDVARTVADIGRLRGELHAMVAMDAALEMGVTRAAVEEAMAAMDFYPGIVAARLGVGRARLGAESVAETLARDLLQVLGFDDIDLQFPVRTRSGRIYWADLRVGNHLVEVHGVLKLRPVSDGGLADRPADDVAREMQERASLISARRLGISDLWWKDVRGPGRQLAGLRLLRDIATTCDRYGPTLHPELAEEAERIRAAHPRRRTPGTLGA
ncbi:type IV toxin-antitoxin system AbiEi family antitoxin domain-containing protein [Nocardioides nanhaiensis]